MRLFVDVAGVQIQPWLARSRSLAGRRGASAALADATSTVRVAELLDRAGLTGAARIAQEAGQIDGVIHLEVTDPDALDRVVDTCVAHLRRALPALAVSAVWGTGGDYLSAFRDEIKPRLASGDVRHDLPHLPDFPLVARCDLCHADAATELLAARDATEQDSRVCPDCHVRHRTTRASAAEARLRTALAATPPSDEGQVHGHHLDADQLHFAQDFDELAATMVALDSGYDRPDGTQLGTVAADGNAVGALLDHIAEHGCIASRAEAAQRLHEANLHAVTVATHRIRAHADTPVLPVIPHVLAGDDLLVSVPAAGAWPFLRTYLTSYQATLAQLVAGCPQRRNNPPSVSAGLVLSHHSEPFAQLVDLATDLLNQAKREFRGQQAAVAWLDMTFDGRRRLRDRAALTLTDLDGPLGAAVRRLAGVEESQRQVLADLVQRAGDDAARVGAAQAERLGLTGELAPFLPGPDREPVLDLATALTLARWFG